MTYNAEQLLVLTAQFEELVNNSLEKTATKKEKNPSAAVRNRGDVCVPAEKAKDDKDHFPINSVSQARNALAQAAKFDLVPDWFKGTLTQLKELVKKKVHKKFPSIDKE